METTLLSTGIDIGTSTTGMVISRLTVKNTAGMFTVPRMTIVDKEIVYKSRIYQTPLLDEYHIDVQRMQQLLREEYRQAGITPEQLDTGAVIITGESAVKENARAVLQAMSEFAGDFVVATAGPDLESVICVQDSTRLGYVNDVEIDMTTGRIAALVVPGRGKGGLLGRREDFIIPWESVRGIGDEIILTSFCPQGGPPPAPWEENPPR